MHSCSSRVVEIASLAVSASLVGVLTIILSSFITLPPGRPPASPIIPVFNISISPLLQLPVPIMYAHHTRPRPLRDRVFISLTVQADFSPVWDWNTKAIYIACIARYRTNKFVINDVTVLDAIIHSREEAEHWWLDKAEKYSIEDAGINTLAGVRVELVLKYQILRYCGYSPVSEVSPTGQTTVAFRLPDRYDTLRTMRDREK